VKHLCSRLVATGCAGFFCVACFGQNPPSFTTKTSVSGPTPSHIYALDVNNDGFSDIIQDTANPGTTGSYFTVSINNGDGTFRPPVTYKVNSSTWIPLTWGDFNQDGKVDIAVLLPNTAQIAVYLGNGDGTFQSPVTTTVSLPSGTTFAGSPIVAADFNHDGNQDVVAAASNGGVWSIYLLEGDGTGHFTNPTAIYYPTSGWSVQNIVAGDFDTDDNADVALLESMPCSDGGDNCYSNVVALFGSGSTTFDAVDVTTVDGNMSLASADLNADGATDLYGIEYGSNQLAVFLGRYSRDFTYYYTSITPSTPGADQTIGTPVAFAEFADGWDVAATVTTYSSSGSPSYQMVYFNSPGYNPTAAITYVPSPAGSAAYQVGPVAGNFNGDLLPDMVISGSSSTNSPTSTLYAALNNSEVDLGDPCNYPSSGQGIRLCSPSSQTTPGQIEFSASANSFGQLRKMELWIDGQKQGETHNVWGGSGNFNWFMDGLAAGTHSATIYAANIDNTLQRYDFPVTVGNTCGPPPQGAYGVNICSPASGGTYNDPVSVIATAKITGTLARMEVWIDGVKEYTETNSTSLNTSFTLTQTYHEFDIYAVNTTGTVWETSVSASARESQ